MAVYTGQNGVIKVNGTAIAELRSFSLEHTFETIENTTMSSTTVARTYRKGLKTFSGTADVFYDDTHHTSITEMVGGADAGDVVTAIFYPGGEPGVGVTLPTLSGSILITGYNMTSNIDNLIEASITFQGSGDLTLGTETG